MNRTSVRMEGAQNIMLYDIENQSTINVEGGIEIAREKLLSAALALPYEEKVQLLRFIEKGRNQFQAR